MTSTKSEMTITKTFSNIKSSKEIISNPSKILNVKDATVKEINKVNKTSVFPIMTIWHSISKKPPETKKNTIRQFKAIKEINKNPQYLPLKSSTLS